MNTSSHRSRLRFEVLNLFIDHGARDANLSLAAFATWVILYRHTRNDLVSIPVSTIMTSTGLCKSAVQRALAELTKKNMLRNVRKGGLGHGTTQRELAPRPVVVKGVTTP
jgi:hypothetical protein